MLKNGIDAAAARAFAQGPGQTRQYFSLTGGNHLYVTIFGIAYPSMQCESRRLAMDEPAKTHSLHAAFDEVMTDHTNRQ